MSNLDHMTDEQVSDLERMVVWQKAVIAKRDATIIQLRTMLDALTERMSTRLAADPATVDRLLDDIRNA